MVAKCRDRMAKWNVVTTLENITKLIGLPRGDKIAHRYRWSLSSFLLNELQSDRRAACRMWGDHAEPPCAICGRNYSDGIRHLQGVGRHQCCLWRTWCDEIIEAEGVPEPAATADLFNPGGDIVVKLRLIHRLHVLYGWEYHYNYTINKHNTMSLWRFLKRSPA